MGVCVGLKIGDANVARMQRCNEVGGKICTTLETESARCGVRCAKRRMHSASIPQAFGGGGWSTTEEGGAREKDEWEQSGEDSEIIPMRREVVTSGGGQKLFFFRYECAATEARPRRHWRHWPAAFVCDTRQPMRARRVQCPIRWRGRGYASPHISRGRYTVEQVYPPFATPFRHSPLFTPFPHSTTRSH